jgi:hypothetical protein
MSKCVFLGTLLHLCLITYFRHVQDYNRKTFIVLGHKHGASEACKISVVKIDPIIEHEQSSLEHLSIDKH